MIVNSKISKIHQKTWARLAAFLLTATLVVGQVGPFAGIDVNVQALSFVRQWMNVTLSSGTVNIRSSPSVDNNVIDYLSDGHRVYVWTSEVNGGNTWYLVTYVSGNYPRTGYISSAYVRATTTSADATFESYLSTQGFPDSYKPALRKLHALHPDWVFRAQDTNLNWNTVLDNESAAFRSLIPMTFNKSLRSTNPITYVAASNSWIDYGGAAISSAGWVMANRQTLSFYMDPRNMLDSYRIFMFESLSYDSEIHTAAGVNAIFGTTFMGNNASFAYNGGQMTYAQAFIDAANASDVSPYHLAARSRQEVGNYSGSVTGTYSASYPRVYNYYNIGASDTGDPIINGLQWALLGSDRSSAYTTTDERYLIPWQDTLDGSGNVTNALGRYRSIVGGAKYIGASYINAGQDSLYLQKFDVMYDTVYGLYWHQYMTNISAPYAESASLSSTYNSMGIINSNFVFNIPVYDNMPDEPVPLPVGNSNVNNYLSSLKVNGTAVSPTFNRSTTSGYSVTVPYTTTTADIQTTTESQYAAVTITGPGSLEVGNNTYTVTVQASYGNDPRNYTLNVIRQLPTDITPPVITLSSYATTPVNTDITVTATTNEGTLNATSYTFTENGTFTFTATDETGNITTQVVTINTIDKVAPTTPTALATPSTTTSTSVSVTPTFSTDTVIKQFKVGSTGTWTAYSSPVVVTANDTIYFKAQDAAGNWSTEGAYVVNNIDTVLPTTPTATASLTTATNLPVTITPSYSADSASREYKIGENGTWTTYTAPFMVSANNTIYFRGQDAAGNYSLIGQFEVSNIDTTAPTTPTAIASTTVETGNPVTVTASFSEDAVVQQYRLGENGTWTIYTEPVSISANATIYFKAQDAVGNWSLTGSLDITNINTTVPATPTAVAYPLTQTDGNVTVTPTFSTDSVTKQYKIGATGTWETYTTPLTIDANTTVYFKGINAVNTPSLEGSIDIANIDQTVTIAPTATVSTTEPTNDTVTVTPTFSAGSINKLYKLTEDSDWQLYTTPVEVTENTTVSFKSQNDYGQSNNIWSTVTSTVISNIDTTPPIITVADYSTAMTNGNITVSVSTNEGSLNATSYTFSANGNYTFIATDSAGNVTTQTVTMTSIDKTAPTTPTAAASTALPTKDAITVTATFDSDSHVKQYKIGVDGTWIDYIEAISFTTNGTLYLKAQDAVGNWSAEGSYVISNIDTTAPTTPTASASPTISTSGRVVVTATFSTDSAIREYKIGTAGTWTSYTGPVSLTENGTIYFRAQDSVGNLSSEGSVVITNIDPTAEAVVQPSEDPIEETVSVQLAAIIPEITVVTVSVDSPTTTTTTTTTTATTEAASSGGGGGGDEPAVVVQSSTYSISGNLITGLDPSARLNTVSALSSQLSIPSGSTVSVKNAAGSTISSSALIGTGYLIQILSGTSVSASYTAIVYGDTNGDGSINITDVATLYKYVRNKQTLGTAYQLAGDTDRNTKVNITDVATAFKHVRSKLTINQ
ncbi:MAG: SH3 domain-containing protein [Eubacteriales bacterium]|nr:SH3 domain-containing protein [Eubacteriales bacterium]